MQRMLEDSIDYFLLCTAEWTPRWFNKPKFHIVRHLLYHVHRFGPAILFATEAFESFNAVIRTQSVHSNRQAHSRDIAVGFANCNRVRHLVSGGAFLRRPLDSNHSGDNSSDLLRRGPNRQPHRRFTLPVISRDVDPSLWSFAGSEVQGLTWAGRQFGVIARQLGIKDDVIYIPGRTYTVFPKIVPTNHLCGRVTRQSNS